MKVRMMFFLLALYLCSHTSDAKWTTSLTGSSSKCPFRLAGVPHCSPIFIFQKELLCIPTEVEDNDYITLTCEKDCNIRSITEDFRIRSCVYPIFIGYSSWISKVLDNMLQKAHITVVSYIQAYYKIDDIGKETTNVFKQFLNLLMIRYQGPGKPPLFHSYKWGKKLLLDLTVNDISRKAIGQRYLLKKTYGSDEKRHLRIAYVNYVPFCIINNDNTLSGIDIDLLHLLAEKMWASVSFHHSDSWGGLKNGTWTGMVRDLQVGRADIASCGLSTTYKRSQVVDFTTPYDTGSFSWASPLPQPLPNYVSLILPFNYPVWILVIVSAILVGLTVTFIASVISKTNQVKDQYCSFMTSVSLAFRILSTNSVTSFPLNLSARLVTGIWTLMAFLIVVSYSANLTSFLTTPPMDRPLLMLEDVTKATHTEKVTFSTYKVSVISEWSEASTNPHYRQMYSEFKGGNIAEVLQEIAEGRNALVFFTTRSLYGIHAKLYGLNADKKVSFSHDSVFNRVYGFTLQQDSIYTYEVHLWTTMIREYGFALKFTNDHLNMEEASKPPIEAFPLTLSHFQSPTIFWVFGVALGFSAFIFELIHFRSLRSVRKQ